ncbi:MAG: PDZ domain-containing protein [Deltaproteobacteria bacterium]|nr:PDZ domain-containing protein [Deltaproteobacteria bacterium]
MNILISAILGWALFFVSSVGAEEFLREGMPIEFEQAGACGAANPHFEELARVLSPSVVNISVENETFSEEKESVTPGFPFFRNDPEQLVRSLGSGFIVDKSGYIVTNNHVIEKSDKIIVRLLDDKTDYIAEVVGVDEKTDLAVIEIKPKTELVPVFVGDSEKLKVGEWVLAIGNQFHLGQTVTQGIVSAKSRRGFTSRGGPYDDFIQTDASINPGSSGGPLFNTCGQVVGINTAIFSPGRTQFGGAGFNIGIGFAIPINLAKGVLQQLRTNGKVTRGMLGVIIQNVTPDIAEALRLKEAHGALVADVMKGSPADKVGFKIKDIIVRYDGKPVREHDNLPLLVANTPIGRVVEVEILRDGKSMILKPKVVELSKDFAEKEKDKVRPVPNEIGITVQKVTEDIANSLGLASVRGVIVTGVKLNSPAYRAGIERGDIIEEINNQSVVDEETLASILKSIDKANPVLVLIRKKEGTRFLTLKLN